jgi:mono/diheme cytochrome c family protein
MRKISLAVVAVVVATMDVASAQSDTAQLQERGKALLAKQCSHCHDIETSGKSPVPQAPPLWSLMRRYSPESLEESLAEGLTTGHEKMPEFVFESDDIAAIISYLGTLRGSR